jgi:hypothetical protein
MVHGIYVKNRPKSKWQLISVKLSAEGALKVLDNALKQAEIDGFTEAKGAIQIFESAFYIPETLKEIKDQKLIYN